jgi:hypothetical protein
MKFLYGSGSGDPYLWLMDSGPGGPKTLWILRIRIRNTAKKSTYKKTNIKGPDPDEGSHTKYALI